MSALPKHPIRSFCDPRLHIIRAISTLHKQLTNSIAFCYKRAKLSPAAPASLAVKNLQACGWRHQGRDLAPQTSTVSTRILPNTCLIVLPLEFLHGPQPGLVVLTCPNKAWCSFYAAQYSVNASFLPTVRRLCAICSAGVGSSSFFLSAWSNMPASKKPSEKR